MAGFGFSPNDIVEFGKFAVKITAALKDDGGSASEYQEAIGWCESFQDVLKVIQNLELSNATVAFADKLKEQSERTKEFVVGFKKKMAKYEKALGKDSSKGMQHGTMKKVQWAMMAAGDLDKFAQSLQMRIKSLEMFMASKTLANADQIPSLRIEAAQVGDSIHDLRRTVLRMASQQDNMSSQMSNIFSEIRYLRSTSSPDLGPRVIELTGMITHLLGSTTHLPLLGDVPRVWTLPDGMDYVTEKDKVSVGSFVRARESDNGKIIRKPSRRHETNVNINDQVMTLTGPMDVSDSVFPAHDSSQDENWIRDTKEVLQALQLPSITTEDIDTGHETPEPSPGGDTLPSASTGAQEDQATASGGNAGQKSRRRPDMWSKMKSRRSGLRTNGVSMRSGMLDPISALDMAGNIITVASVIFQAVSLFQNLTSAPKTLARVAGRLEDLAPLLEQVAELIATGEDFRGGRSILDRASSLYKYIAETMHSMDVDAHHSKFLAVVGQGLKKGRMESLLEETESLKLTLSFTLQAHTAKIQSQSHRELIMASQRMEQLDYRLQMLHDTFKPSARNGKLR